MASGSGQSAFTIRFAPTGTGTHQATVTIANNDSQKDPYTFLIQGTGIPAPAPHINVLGYHHLITNGDTTPEELDGTDFGGVEQLGRLSD